MKRLLFAFALLVALVAPASATTYNIMVFGDSISYGYGTTNPGQFGYPTIAAEQLGAATLENPAIGGTVSADINRVEARFAPASADHIIIYAGTNDVLHRSPSGTIAAYSDFDALAATVNGLYPNAVVLVITLRQFGSTASVISAWNAHEKADAANYGWRVLDLEPYCASGTTCQTSFYPDDIHPNNAGAAALGAMVATALT